MDNSLSPQAGKVADRIRVFQDSQPLETRIPSFHLPPRILIQARDAGVTSAYGRREDSGFASPAGGASMDGNEGIHGDGRPPVASIFYKHTHYLEQQYEQEDEHGTFPLRPFASTDGPDERALSRRGTERQNSHQIRRQHRSMENVADDPALEIAMARSRLRSIAPKQKPAQEVPEPLHGRGHTMDELNIMLDDAIKNSSPKPEVSSEEQPANLAPKPGFLLRRASTRQDRRRSQSRARISRKTTESVEPRTSDESTRVEYDREEMTQQPMEQDANRRDTVVRRDTLKPPSPAAPRLKELPEPSSGLSPVKQRAALFESLSKKPTGHDSICQHFGHEHDPTHDHVHHHPGPSRKEPKKVHRIKFGDRIEERPATPLIPLTLPTLVTKEKTSRPPSALNREQEDQRPIQIEAVPEEPINDDVFEEKSQERKPSLSWPFKWTIFNKGASAPPQESEPIPAEVEAKDEHYPITRHRVVRSKVQEILQAAEQKDNAEQQRRDAERQRMSRRTTCALPSRRQTAFKCDEPSPETTAEPTLIETPKQQQLQDLQPAAASDGKPRTPLQRAMSKKQVLVPPSQCEPDSGSRASPRKSALQTPVRGRPSIAYCPATGDQKHSVQQQFNLTPTRSGSRQRQGVKVEVEIRDSPEREARDRGDKIVIIRADVSEMDDQGK